MRNYVSGMKFTKALADVLGLDGPIRSITIKADVRWAPEVYVERLVTAEEGGFLETVLQTYQLNERAEHPAPVAQ